MKINNIDLAKVAMVLGDDEYKPGDMVEAHETLFDKPFKVMKAVIIDGRIYVGDSKHVIPCRSI